MSALGWARRSENGARARAGEWTGTHRLEEDQGWVGLRLEEHPHHVLVRASRNVRQMLVDLRLDHCRRDAREFAGRQLPRGFRRANQRFGGGGGDRRRPRLEQ